MTKNMMKFQNSEGFHHSFSLSPCFFQTFHHAFSKPCRIFLNYSEFVHFVPAAPWGYLPLCRQKKFAVAAILLPSSFCREKLASYFLPPKTMLPSAIESLPPIHFFAAQDKAKGVELFQEMLKLFLISVVHLHATGTCVLEQGLYRGGQFFPNLKIYK